MSKVYKFNGEFNSNDQTLEMDMHIQFLKPDANWTEWSPVKVLLDTGATNTHISYSVIPEAIHDACKGNKHVGRAATADLIGFKVSNIHLLLPRKDEEESHSILFLPIGIAFDDSVVKQIRLQENKTYYPVIFGMDLLQLSVLKFNGPNSSFSLEIVFPDKQNNDITSEN